MVSLQLHSPIIHAAPGVPHAPQRSARPRDRAQVILDGIALAAILVTGERSILHANKAAKAVLERRDGLLAHNTVLSCFQDVQIPALAAAVAAAARGHSGALLLDRAGNLPPYQLSISMLNVDGVQTALILFTDPDMQDESLQGRLRALFLLTGAEAELAVALAQGQTISEIAKLRTVSVGTIRIQIKSVAAKMHCRRQAEIAAVVARLPGLNAKP